MISLKVNKNINKDVKKLHIILMPFLRMKVRTSFLWQRQYPATWKPRISERMRQYPGNNGPSSDMALTNHMDQSSLVLLLKAAVS